MSKKLFSLLVLLMSISLLGIIFVQGYWIKTAVQNREEQFSLNINQMLKTVADRIQQGEVNTYYARLQKWIDSIGAPKDSQVREFILWQKNDNTKETFIYSHGLLEEDYNITSKFFDSNLDDDTTSIRNYISRRRTTVIKEGYDVDGKPITPSITSTEVGRLDLYDKAWYEINILERLKRIPIYNRVTLEQISFLISQELHDRELNVNFEFGVFSRGLATKVRSINYPGSQQQKIYTAPLFLDNNGNSEYTLEVVFPNKREFLISSIIWLVILSVIFTLVIIVAYSSALYQLIRQKQISEIKSDFINNMTHEFKTPIATINLALDAMKSPKIFQDSERLQRYLGMIREENKRMHAQVENVLRISKLEKNQLDISKEKVDLHELVNLAISHVSLIVQDRQGCINTHLQAERFIVLGSDVHLTNVLVNILDNAIKYSPDNPKIEVVTENVKNSIIIKIQDQGMGMSKAVLKRVFEKFYREHTGDLHNVKGHGLGLAYVKSIIEDHQGEVYAESERGKGSTFYIKLPLI